MVKHPVISIEIRPNILKYGQILVTSGRFMIFDIEGHSNIYSIIHLTIQNQITNQRAYGLHTGRKKLHKRNGLISLGVILIFN